MQVRRLTTDPPVTIMGDVDDQAVEQLERCVNTHGMAGAIMADGHLGYSMPIGGVVAYPEHVSPSGVGYDIGCGNKAVLTNLHLADIDGHLSSIMDTVVERLNFGPGPGRETADHEVLEKITSTTFRPVQRMHQTARTQLGSIGGGNHYVDIFADEENRIWVGVHFGSRGFGHKIATGFLHLAAGRNFDGTEPGAAPGKKPQRGREDMHALPTLIPVDSDLGQAYIEAMKLAGEYAYAGRDVAVQKVLDILGAHTLDEIHNHHNYAWLEGHRGQQVWVVRKGATPAWPGQRGFVGSTMGEDSVILKGAEAVGPAEDLTALQEDLLYSTVHGAGRAMSRRRAAGKVRRMTVRECNDRDCSYRAPRGQHLPGGLPIPCPDHPDGRLMKRTVEEEVSKGAIDYVTVRKDLAAKGIVIRGGAADEAPGAYKRLPEVLEAQGSTIRVLHTLRPLGVAMAGPGIAADD